MLWLKVSSEVVRHIQMFNTESPVLGCIFMACQTLTVSQRRIRHRVGVYILLKWLTDTQTCQEGLSYPLCLVGCCPRCKVVCKLQLQIKPLDTIPTNREALSQMGWVNDNAEWNALWQLCLHRPSLWHHRLVGRWGWGLVWLFYSRSSLRRFS